MLGLHVRIPRVSEERAMTTVRELIRNHHQEIVASLGERLAATDARPRPERQALSGFLDLLGRGGEADPSALDVGQEEALGRYMSECLHEGCTLAEIVTELGVLGRC